MSEPVTIVGGGIAGLSLGWELLRHGRRVTVREANTIGSGTSHAATSYMEPRLGDPERSAARRMEWESLRLWPAFAKDVEAASGWRGLPRHRGARCRGSCARLR